MNGISSGWLKPWTSAMVVEAVEDALDMRDGAELAILVSERKAMESGEDDRRR